MFIYVYWCLLLFINDYSCLLVYIKIHGWHLIFFWTQEDRQGTDSRSMSGWPGAEYSKSTSRMVSFLAGLPGMFQEDTPMAYNVVPQSDSVQLVCKSHFTRVDEWRLYLYLLWFCKPTNITGGVPPCMAMKQLKTQWIFVSGAKIWQKTVDVAHEIFLGSSCNCFL